jgi:carboxyl-terminal processing protease
VPHSNAFEAFLKNRYDNYFYDIDQVKKYIDTNSVVFDNLIFYAGRITNEYTSDKTICYVRIKTFLVEKNNEMYSAIDSIFNFLQNSDACIFDIRNNGGGYSYLRDAIASRIIANEIQYAYEQYRDGPNATDLTERKVLELKPGISEKYRKPIALLVNKLSGSASEYLTLQLKLAGNVVIIGDTTSGTLSHIEQKRLPNGWRYNLPVSKVTTLDGICLEGIGISPDIRVAQTGTSKDTAFFKALEILSGQR